MIMSAAPPAPPLTNGHIIPKSSGYGLDHAPQSRASWNEGQGPSGSSNGGSAPAPRFRHIKDLQARARTGTNATVYTPVSLGYHNQSTLGQRSAVQYT